MRLRWLLPLFVLGAVLRLALAWRTPLINTDAINFMAIAEGFLHGDFLAATRMNFHPLYSLLIAAAGGSDAGAVAVSILAGVAAGWPLFLLVREIGGIRPAVIALALYELHPVLVDVQSDIFADGLFMLFAMTALLGAVRFAVAGRGIWLAGAGASLCCLTKSEGLIVGLLCGIIIGITVLPRKRPDAVTLRRALLAAAVGLVIVGPLVVYMKVTSGHFKLSPKPSGQRVVSGGGEDEQGTGMWLSRREKHGPMIGSLWYLGVSTVRAIRAVHAILLLAALATLKHWAPRLKAKAWLLCCIGVYIACVWWSNYSIAHQISPRYLLVPVTLSLAFVAAMLDWAGETLMARRPALLRGLAGLTAVAVLMSGSRDIFWGRRTEQAAWREAGEWVLKTAGPGKVIVSTSDKPAYYAKGRAIPADTLLSKERSGDFFIFCEDDLARLKWIADEGHKLPFREARTFPDPRRPGRVIVHVWEHRDP